MQSVRSLLLRRFRVPVSHPLRHSCGNGYGNAGSSILLLLRPFAAEASFLDKKDVTDRVLAVLKKFQKVDPSKISPVAHFQKDLGLDSLDSVELVMAFEEEFSVEIPDSEADKIDSCKAAIDYIAALPKAK